MPTYSYVCRKCGHVQDVFHSISVNPRVKCEECGGGCRRKLGSGAGIIFKGSGFYETDYKRSGSNGSESKSEAKSEAKPEPKAASKPEPKPAKSDGAKKSNAMAGV